jgi:hypothetical protein
MSRATTFVDLVLAGEVLDPEQAIEDWIERWHAAETESLVHEWLGLTREEYALYVERPQFLRAIFAARHLGIPLSKTLEVAADQAAGLAARGVPSSEVPALRKWLEQTGRL